jgi:hypothetical protein
MAPEHVALYQILDAVRRRKNLKFVAPAPMSAFSSEAEIWTKDDKVG